MKQLPVEYLPKFHLKKLFLAVKYLILLLGFRFFLCTVNFKKVIDPVRSLHANSIFTISLKYEDHAPAKFFAYASGFTGSETDLSKHEHVAIRHVVEVNDGRVSVLRRLPV